MSLSKFDQAVSRQGIPTHFRDASVELNDTLEICWASAQSVFGTNAKPEHAINLLPLYMARADAKHREELASYKSGMGA